MQPLKYGGSRYFILNLQTLQQKTLVVDGWTLNVHQMSGSELRIARGQPGDSPPALRVAGHFPSSIHFEPAPRAGLSPPKPRIIFNEAPTTACDESRPAPGHSRGGTATGSSAIQPRPPTTQTCSGSVLQTLPMAALPSPICRIRDGSIPLSRYLRRTGEGPLEY